jgi:cytochrome c-type protein NapC
MKLVNRFSKALGAMLVIFPALTTPAWAIDWASVPSKDIVLLYPGQTSWEWNLTTADHSAADKFKAGKNCIACHGGEEITQGALMVSGKKAEPKPIPSFPGHVVTSVQMAYDADTFYIRFHFTPPEAPKTGMDPKTQTRIAVIFNDEAVKEGVRAGCWASCHEDNTDMPTADGAERTKYLMRTRQKMSRAGGGDLLRPEADLAALRDKGYIQEWWQALLNPGKPVEVVGGTIFDRRTAIPGVLQAQATQDGDAWTVTLSRPRSAPSPWRPLVEGTVYTFGVSIHLGESHSRFHHTSYEYTFALGQAGADLTAVRQ